MTVVFIIAGGSAGLYYIYQMKQEERAERARVQEEAIEAKLAEVREHLQQQADQPAELAEEAGDRAQPNLAAVNIEPGGASEPEVVAAINREADSEPSVARPAVGDTMVITQESTSSGRKNIRRSPRRNKRATPVKSKNAKSVAVPTKVETPKAKPAKPKNDEPLFKEEPAKKEPAQKEPAQKADVPTNELDYLLGGPAPESVKRRKPAAEKSAAAGDDDKKSASAKSNLPKTPSRKTVRSVMGKAAKKASSACAIYATGMVQLEVVVNGQGKVTSARALKKFANTSVGKCAAMVIKKTQFPPFSDSKFSFKYPVRIK